MLRTEFPEPRRRDAEGDLTLNLLVGPPGGGKSTELLGGTVVEPQVYVVTAPRIDLIDEHVGRLHEMAAAAGRTPTIVAVHSKTPSAKGKVERRLRETLNATASAHAIVVTTHAALMGLAPDEIVGLHIRWDELPEGAIASGVVGLAMSWPMMAERYTLTPAAEAGWYRMVPRPEVETVGLRGILDDAGKPLATLHRLAPSRGRVVEVDVVAWEDASVRRSGKVRWRSIWSFASLAGCASLTVAAAGYDESLADHAVRRAGGVDVVRVPVGSARTGQPRIKIRYFTTHPGSTAWWADSRGKRCLVAISRHLEAIEFQGYWSANTCIKDFFAGRLDGAEECSPKLAGANRLRDHTTCALIYSAKATPDDEAIIRALGIDRDAKPVALAKPAPAA